MIEVLTIIDITCLPPSTQNIPNQKLVNRLVESTYPGMCHESIEDDIYLQYIKKETGQYVNM